jgi:hypothetical protein
MENPNSKDYWCPKTKHMFNHCLTQCLKDLCLDFVLFKDLDNTKATSWKELQHNACLQKYIGLFRFQSSHNLHNFTHTCWKLDMWEFKTGHSDSDLISCNVIRRAWNVGWNQYISLGGGVLFIDQCMFTTIFCSSQRFEAFGFEDLV